MVGKLAHVLEETFKKVKNSMWIILILLSGLLFIKCQVNYDKSTGKCQREAKAMQKTKTLLFILCESNNPNRTTNALANDPCIADGRGLYFFSDTKSTNCGSSSSFILTP